MIKNNEFIYCSVPIRQVQDAVLENVAILRNEWSNIRKIPGAFSSGDVSL